MLAAILLAAVVMLVVDRYLLMRQWTEQMSVATSERRDSQIRHLEHVKEMQDTIGRLNESMLADAGKTVRQVPRRGPLEPAAGWLDGTPVDKHIKAIDKAAK